MVPTVARSGPRSGQKWSQKWPKVVPKVGRKWSRSGPRLGQPFGPLGSPAPQEATGAAGLVAPRPPRRRSGRDVKTLPWCREKVLLRVFNPLVQGNVLRDFGRNGPQAGPKWVPKWAPNGTHLGPAWGPLRPKSLRTLPCTSGLNTRSSTFSRDQVVVLRARPDFGLISPRGTAPPERDSVPRDSTTFGGLWLPEVVVSCDTMWGTFENGH